MYILVAGDYFIDDRIRNMPDIESQVEEVFLDSDFRIVNLEAPITGNEPKNRISKTGPYLRSSAENMLPTLKKLNVNMVTLANNHILDYSAKGLFDTFKTLRDNEIYYVGAGKNLEEAAKPFTVEKDGIKIAILSITENEWSIAEDDKPGANPMDIIDNVKQIKTAKLTHDKVICIIHGGHEYYHFPSPRMLKQYRFYAENGADAIVGHHTHCIGGYEIYHKVPIIYSLGNFLFTLPSKRKEWYTGLLANLKIDKDKPISFELLPIKQDRECFKLSLYKNEKKKAIIHEIENFNKVIACTENLKVQYCNFVNRNSNQYLNNLSPANAFSNRYLIVVSNKFGIKKIFLNRHYFKIIFNLIRCEAHSDIVKTICKQFSR